MSWWAAMAAYLTKIFAPRREVRCFPAKGRRRTSTLEGRVAISPACRLSELVARPPGTVGTNDHPTFANCISCYRSSARRPSTITPPGSGPADLRTITSALRSYLRFLAGVGLCRPNLDHAIPPVLQWRLSSLPRYLAAADVERVIASCDHSPEGACGTVQSCSYWLAWGCGPGMWPDSDSAISNGRPACCA